MNLLKTIQKYLKGHHLLMLVGVCVLVYAMMNYSNKQSNVTAAMSNKKKQENVPSAAGEDGNETYYSVGGSMSDNNNVDNKNVDNKNSKKKDTCDPSCLLPKDTNSEWGKLNPSGQGDLENVSLLKAGSHIGINTVGNSLRNANLQIRGEPANPRGDVGPWMQSTIDTNPYESKKLCA